MVRLSDLQTKVFFRLLGPPEPRGPMPKHASILHIVGNVTHLMCQYLEKTVKIYELLVTEAKPDRPRLIVYGTVSELIVFSLRLPEHKDKIFKWRQFVLKNFFIQIGVVFGYKPFADSHNYIDSIA